MESERRFSTDIRFATFESDSENVKKWSRVDALQSRIPIEEHSKTVLSDCSFTPANSINNSIKGG
jgi:hypothetical protein